MQDYSPSFYSFSHSNVIVHRPALVHLTTKILVSNIAKNTWKVEDWNWEKIFCGHYRSFFNHCNQKASEFGEKCKIRAITPFKVIKVGINRKPACDFLLVINTNWHPISYCFRVNAAYCSNFGHLAFLSHSLET